MTGLLKSALASDYLILSSAGSHAREDWGVIIARKAADIAKVGHTIWVLNSNAARPHAVQSICNQHNARYVIFLSRKRNGSGNSGPSTDDEAKSYSTDNATWRSLDGFGLSPVTGKINRGTTGLWLDALEEVPSSTLNLGCFRKHGTNGLLRQFERHESTYAVQRIAPVQEGAYQVLGVGRLVSSFAVWLSVKAQ
jgi:hypothetical protein